MSSEGGFDCHLHVIDPDRFAYPGGPGYQPGPEERGNAEMLEETFEAHGIRGALLVQPSTYLTDNRCMLDAMARLPGSYRGIAVVSPDVDDKELDALASAGVVGVRINVENLGPSILKDTPRLLPRLVERDWFIQLHMLAKRLPDYAAMLTAPLANAANSKLIFDHCGRPEIDRGIEEPGFQEVLRLGREGLALIKLSGAFRNSQKPFPHDDMDPFVDAILASFDVERCIFGSDWPFFGDVKPPYGETLAMLQRWVPDDRDRHQILTQNPATYFGLG